MLIVLLFSTGAQSQMGGLPADQLEALRKSAQESGSRDAAAGEAEKQPTIQLYDGPVASDQPSRLEIFYSNRAGKPLLQFGYDTFGSGQDVILRKTGGVQEDYIIGIGDTISIDLRGQENSSFRLDVDNVGRIILPRLDPIVAAGRRFGDFKGQLEEHVKSAYIATNVYVSIGLVRQVSVLMSGEVNNPGPLTLSGISTSLDALSLAGGIKKSGSLRDIKIFRGNEVIKLDLYSVLLGNHTTSDFSIMGGDRIHVAPIGKAVAVGGWVKRPGIYELLGDRPVMSASQIIKLAGGYEIKGRYNLSLMRVEANGSLKVVDVTASKTKVREGDLLLVETSDEKAHGGIHLEGHVRQSGTIALTTARTLKSLLGDGEILGDEVYMPFALVSRIETRSQLKNYIPFSPLEIIQGTGDLTLQENDIIHIFSREEVRSISQSLDDDNVSMFAQSNNFNEGDADIETEVMAPAENFGARRLEDLVGEWDRKEQEKAKARYDKAGPTGKADKSKIPSVSTRHVLKTALDKMGAGRRIDFQDPALLSLFKESRISFFGAVKAPGEYFILPGISLGQAIEVAGGTAIQADLSAVEVTSTRFMPLTGQSETKRSSLVLNTDTLHNVKLQPLDVVRIRRVFSNRTDGSVKISGEVRYPGQFDLVRGERLSSLLQRAGGLTSTAYPYGAVFTRISAAKAERDARNEMVDQMQNQLATIVATGDVNTNGAAFLSKLIVDLKKAPTIGRVSIEADPAVIMSGGQNDPLLEPGDRLIIPPRPNSVAVIGEVLKASSYHFDSNLSGREYIKLAGGYAQFADKKRAFVIMPDGQAKRLNERRWSFGDAMIAPGSVVVVPRNLRPFQWDEVLLSVTQISSQMALTAASISVIGN